VILHFKFILDSDLNVGKLFHCALPNACIFFPSGWPLSV